MKRAPSTEELSKLLLTLYAAPMSPELWPKFLTELSEMLELGGAALLFQDLTQPFISLQAHVGTDPSANNPYESYYSAMDEWRPRTLCMPVGEIATAEELCSPQLLKKTEFYQDFLRPYNINLFCAVPTENRSPALEIVTFYHQGWDAKPRDSAVLDTIRLLVPHLKSALRTRRHLCALERQTKDFSSALDLLEFGILLLDEKGRSLFINKAAKEICDRKDGLVFRDGRLWAESPSESRRLRSLIDRAVQTGTGRETFAGGALSISRLAQNPLQILVSPFTARTHLLTVTRQTMAVVFVSDPDRTSVSAEHMMRLLHGLTAAETELLRLLLAGYDVSEMAGLRAVSRETIRTQIKSIFSKTGTRRQSELVRLAATLPRVNPTA